MEDDDPGTPNRPLCELLSPKELEVAYLILDESSNREIGVRLAIALDTVENYIQHIFNKLGMSSRIEVAHYVVREIFFATHTIYSPVPQ